MPKRLTLTSLALGLGLWIWLALGTTGPVLAAFDPVLWPYSKELTAAPSGFALVNLDPEVLRDSQPELRDIRITDQNGRELPYLLNDLAPPVKTYPAVLFDVASDSEATRATLDLGQTGRLHNQLTLDLKPINQNYLREVMVEGSDDNRSWVLITKEQIYSLNHQEGFIKGEPKLETPKPELKAVYLKNEVNYAPVSYRYLRLKIERQGGEALPVIRASVNFAPTSKYTSAELPAALITNRNDPKTKATEIIMDLGAANYLVNEICLEISDSNYERTVYAYTGDDLADWQLVNQQDIFDYEWQGYKAEQRDIKTHFLSRRYLRLSINNQDSPELTISQITVQGSTPKLLVNLPGTPATPGPEHGNNVASLWYGNPAASKPDYDLSKFAAQIERENLPVVSLGPEKPNPEYQAPVKPWSERNRWLLNLVLVLTAGALSILAYRNLGRIKDQD